MIAAVSFAIDGDPIPTARARVTRNGTFTPKRSRDAQARVAEAWDAAVADLNWPVEPERQYAVRLIFARGAYTRADADNLVKTVLDGLTGRAWVDDRQVAIGSWLITWAPRLNNQQGRTMVQVRRLPLNMKGNALPLDTIATDPKDADP